eukprot:2554944-Rhodomonas_salina.3
MSSRAALETEVAGFSIIWCEHISRTGNLVTELGRTMERSTIVKLGGERENCSLRSGIMLAFMLVSYPCFETTGCDAEDTRRSMCAGQIAHALLMHHHLHDLPSTQSSTSIQDC